LATGNDGVLITSAAGLPSISSTLPTTVQTNITRLGVVAQNVFLTSNPASIRYLALNGDSTNTGTFILQAGPGSAGFGGGLIMYGHSHASKPGWVTAGISSGSSGSFAVNNHGVGSGNDVFIVNEFGRIISGNQATGSSGSLTLNGSTAGLGSLLFSTVNNSGDFQNNLVNAATSAARTYTLPDATGTITVLGNAVTGSGSIVLATSPTLVTPIIGVATGTSLSLTGNATVGTSQANANLSIKSSVVTGGVGASELFFASSNSTFRGYLSYNLATDTLAIGTGLATRGTWSSSGLSIVSTLSAAAAAISGVTTITNSTSTSTSLAVTNSATVGATTGISSIVSGNAASVTKIAGLFSITATGTSSTNYGVQANVTQTDVGVGSLFASEGNLFVNRSSGASAANYFAGNFALTTGAGASTISNSLYAAVRANAINSRTGEAVVTSGVYSTAVGPGTIYGVFASATGGTANWGIYSNAGTNYFAGNVSIGNTSPTNALTVTGAGSFTGALSADSASFTSALTGVNGGTGVANTGKTITIGGNLSTVGAFTADFTMTANTAVTFPTTGTLATTATASGIINSGLINQLAFYAAAGTTLSGVTTANNGLLVTSAGGVPSIGNAILANITVNGVQVGRGAANVASNVFIGTAGNAAATGTNNLAVSSSTCFQNLTTGSSNTGFGLNVFESLTTGSSNLSIGADSGRLLVSGSNNVFFGNNAGGTYLGFSAIMVGNNAGLTITSGSQTVMIGQNSGSNVAPGAATMTTSTFNTIIGSNASANAASPVGVIALGGNAVALAATGVGSGDNGSGISIGSDLYKVGFRGDGTIYPGNMWRPRINGATYMIPLLVDGSTSTGTGNNVLATSPTLVTPVLGVATATSVAASTNITTGVAGTNSGLTVGATVSAAAYSYNITKVIGGSAATTFLFLTIPAAAMFVGVECLIINSRASSAGVGTSFLEKRYFTISRNGSGTDVVLDAATALDLNFTSTTAGGAQNTTSGATTIIRNGAEPNTAAQVVVLQINPATTGGSTGSAIIYCTVLALGSVISIS